MTIKGTGINQLGIAQENGEDGLGSDYAKSVVTLTNNGSIELGGESSIGIYTDNGIIQNNGIIKVIGLDSYGIYGLNGTETTTKTGSLIEVGEQAAGILAVSHKTDPITNLLMKEIFGDGSFKIEHNGLITVNGNNSYGIYADNNDDILTSIIADKIVNLNSGSTIDLSQTTDEGTGVVLNKATLNDSGIIKVGSKGTGIYSKDSSVNLDGSIIDILGDNSYGIVLDGNSTLTSTGSINTVNVNGDNTIVFVATANPGGSYTVGNMLVNGNNSSNLTLAAVKDNSFIYDGYLTGVGSNSVILVGDNSDIGFGINSVIDSSSNGVTGLYSKGKSTENKGSLTLNGDNSIGSYTENGNSLNNNEIILGTSGIGIYNANGTANNLNGKISVGDTGAGIYGEKSFLIKNNALIVGNDSSVGIYSKGDTVGTAILNDGSITLGKNGRLNVSTSEIKETPYMLRLINKRVSSSSLDVKKGESVSWINMEDSPKRVLTLVSEEKLFENTKLVYKRAFTYTFNETGDYHFSIVGQPKMNVTVNVAEPWKIAPENWRVESSGKTGLMKYSN